MTNKRKDCPMRHENGNCTVAGGFCTAVNDPVCEALHNAFDCGYRSALRQQEQERKAATGEGLRCKYIVRKADTGEGVDGCFVLRPDRDRAAVAALRAYASATDNDVLATDILNWVGQESNEPNDWICTLKCTALMDEGMCSHGGLCCLYESQRSIKENQPLTLDELRQMDGEPVWTVTTGISSSGRWELCTCETVCACPLHKVLRCVTADGEVTDYDLDTYGKTWLAYCHKPEEGTD